MLRRLCVRTFLRSTNWAQHSNLQYAYGIHRQFSQNIKTFMCPEPGEGTVEVTVKEWFVKPGAKVKDGDEIGLGSYEKADFTIYAPYDGIVHEFCVKAGEMARVHKPLIKFETAGGDVKEHKQSKGDASTSGSKDKSDEAKKSSESKSPSQPTHAQDIKALPAARKFAKEQGIDLANVTPTGNHGHVLKEDVVAFIERSKSHPTSSASASASASSASVPSTAGPDKRSTQPIPKAKLPTLLQNDVVEQITGLKVAMVKKMKASNDVPQFGYADEISMDELVHLRKEFKQLTEKFGIRLSFMPFILKAVSLSLRRFPMLNGHVNEDCTQLIHRKSHNIGVAVDSPIGLIVPNIKDCQDKSVLQIAVDLDALVERAKAGKISPKDIQGGTFTLSNIGTIGGTYCRPLLFVPEVCIGAVGTIQTLPRYNKKHDVYPAHVMAVSWSADHRVIDGATVARFSNELKQYLEHPASMLLHLQ